MNELTEEKEGKKLEEKIDRLDFLRSMAGASIALGAGLATLAAVRPKTALSQTKDEARGKDILEAMRDDVKKAAGNPAVKWGMLIDLRRCTGCSACTVGCMAEQKSPPGVMYRPVYSEESGTFPKVSRRFTPRPCNQCENAACYDVCPKKDKATWLNKSGIGNGIVMINYDECISCGACVAACPYKARTLDPGAFYTDDTPQVQAYEKAPTWEYGKESIRNRSKPPVDKARKCHFCYHRLSSGMLPACVNTCVCRANYFGDTSDPSSVISKMIAENKGKIKVLKSVEGDPGAAFGGARHVGAVEAGYPGTTPTFADAADTKPRVYFILS